METNNKLLAKVALLSVLFAATTAFADAKKDKEDKENRNPLGCRDVGYEFDLKALRLHPESVGPRQSMYFIFNKLNQTVNLYQMRDEESSRSMYFNHSITGRQWAVLSTIEKQMKYICTVNEPGMRYGKIVDCADSLQVCEYNNVKYGLNNRGNYWLVNSNTRGGAIQEVIRYGIIPAL